MLLYATGARGGRPGNVSEKPQRTTIGRKAEDLAAAHVEADGFVILWRNVRIGPLEIDLVAKKDDLVAIVEVRSRGTTAFEGPLASMTWQKRQTLLRAASALWRGRLRKMPDVQRVRIDVIAIRQSAEGQRVDWIKGALAVER